jgi:hypothetical protein
MDFQALTEGKRKYIMIPGMVPNTKSARFPQRQTVHCRGERADKEKGGTQMKYDYAKISDEQLAELNALQAKLSGGGKQVVLLAVEKKFEIAKLTDEELKKINALEKELSKDGRELVLVALSR